MRQGRPSPGSRPGLQYRVLGHPDFDQHRPEVRAAQVAGHRCGGVSRPSSTAATTHMSKLLESKALGLSGNVSIRQIMSAAKTALGERRSLGPLLEYLKVGRHS